MSKMGDMAAAIEDLRKCAVTINDTTAWLADLFTSQNPELAELAPAEPALTLESVRAVLAEKSRKGYTAQIRALLLKYGASKLSEIDPANYNALLAEAEGLTDAR